MIRCLLRSGWWVFDGVRMRDVEPLPTWMLIPPISLYTEVVSDFEGFYLSFSYEEGTAVRQPSGNTNRANKIHELASPRLGLRISHLLRG